MTAQDDYTGDVTVGGPAATRTIGGLQITKVAVGPLENNAYLLRCRATGDTLLIDAADEPVRLLDERRDGQLVAVLTTHAHPDHWQALETVVGVTGAQTLAHPLDAGALPVPVRVLLDDGDHVDVGDVRLRVVHLRGHTPGSIAVCYDAGAAGMHLFTGDSLFPGGPGRTTSPESFTSLMNDLEAKIFGLLPDSTWVYPGHGRDTTLGAERPHLGSWRARGW